MSEVVSICVTGQLVWAESHSVPRVAVNSFYPPIHDLKIKRTSAQTQPHLTLLLLLEPLLEDSLGQSARRTARSDRRLVSGQCPQNVQYYRGGGARSPAPEPPEAPARSHTHGEHRRGGHLGQER